MTSFAQGALLAYLLSISFTQSVELSLAPLQKLVEYEYNLSFSELIPGTMYQGSIKASWAVPPSALSGLEGKTVRVKISAIAQDNTTVFFLLPDGTRAKQAAVFLACRVENSGCANSSNLSATIPVLASALPENPQKATITMVSEVVEEAPPTEAESIAKSIESLFAVNSTSQQGNLSVQFSPPVFFNASENGSGTENFLDTLKPEGDPKDALSFISQNPLISIFGLVIVIAITGAYLLKNRD
ncbi:MAG: hypothetical protein N3E51_00130 [Candidatus Micrarchaeota archaeon]|nr:hypothetical protein [Candidatus Micrarchaeota archaeon]